MPQAESSHTQAADPSINYGTATFLPLTTILRYSPSSLLDSSKTHANIWTLRLVRIVSHPHGFHTPKLTLSNCSYLHWLSDIFFCILQQNTPPLPSGLLSRYTKQNRLLITGQVISSFSPTPENALIFPIPNFISITASIYTHWKEEGTWYNLASPLSILKHSLSPPITLRQTTILTSIP